MSIVLWPRQEILQLVVPQLGSIGKTLDNTTAINAVRQLSKYQSVEGKISFDRWLIVGKDTLHWNDNCIHLFWELLCLAVYYLNRDPSLYPNREDVQIDLEHLAVFLVMHVVDTIPNKQTTSPIIQYDSVWPSTHPNIDGEPIGQMAGLGPLGSPISSPPKTETKVKKFGGSPLSPRSPKSQPSSPSHAEKQKARALKAPRSMAQYLHAVRQKFPVLLRALGSEEEQDSLIGHFTPEKGSDESGGGGLDFAVSRKTIDALGLIMCGGRSRDEHIANLSVLHPNWSGELDTSGRRDDGPASQSAMVMPSPYTNNSSLGYSELVGWINLHLAMNDILYPVSLASFYSSARVTSDSNAIELEATVLNDASSGVKNTQPSRTCTPVSSLTRFTPCVVQNCSTTIMHVVTSGPARAPSFRRINSARSQSYDRAGDRSSYDMMDINQQYTRSTSKYELEPEALHRSGPKIDFDIPIIDGPHSRMDDDDRITVPSVNNAEDLDLLLKSHDHGPAPDRSLWSQPNTTFNGSFYFGNTSSSNNLAFQRPELSLPQLFVSDCKKSQLYFISPYYSGSINGCEDTEIIIGAVFGAVIVEGCERVKITVACRKLIVNNCLDCEFNIATLSPTTVSGDSRGLHFGPYNASYRNLKSHLQMADLQALSASGADSSPESASNCWSSLCDVNNCLETIPTSNSPSGYAIDAMSLTSSLALLPTPTAATAQIATLEKFKPVMVPFKQECLPYETCPIGIPVEFTDHLRAQADSVLRIKGHLVSVINEWAMQSTNAAAVAAVAGAGGSAPAPASAAGEDEKKDSKNVASQLISKKFLEWLMASEHSQAVMDLVRLDAEKASSH